MLPSIGNRAGAGTLWDIRREMDRLFEGLDQSGQTNGSTGWIPAMDVVETADEILCHLEVPGINPDDLEIRVENNLVTIAGEKRYERSNTEREAGFRHVERRYGRFERSFTIPRTVDAERVRARHDNGVLTLVLPKAEQSRPRRIELEATGKQA